MTYTSKTAEEQERTFCSLLLAFLSPVCLYYMLCESWKRKYYHQGVFNLATPLVCPLPRLPLLFVTWVYDTGGEARAVPCCIKATSSAWLLVGEILYFFAALLTGCGSFGQGASLSAWLWVFTGGKAAASFAAASALLLDSRTQQSVCLCDN